MRRVLIALMLLLPLPACAHAQAGVSDSVQVRNRCRLAMQVIETGHPEPHARWAYEYVRRCGDEGASVTAEAMRAAATDEDRATWELLTLPAFYVQDAGIFGSALRLAEDSGASTTARVYSIKVLILALSPGTTLSFDDLTRGSNAQRVCFGTGPGTHHQVQVLSPLPPDYRERVAVLMTRLSNADDEKAEVRQAATCAAAHARLR